MLRSAAMSGTNVFDDIPPWAAVAEEENLRGIGEDARFYRVFMGSDKAQDHPLGPQWKSMGDAVEFARAMDREFRASMMPNANTDGPLVLTDHQMNVIETSLANGSDDDAISIISQIASVCREWGGEHISDGLTAVLADLEHPEPDGVDVPPGDWHSLQYVRLTMPTIIPKERELVPVPHVVDGWIVGYTLGLALKGEATDVAQIAGEEER